MTPPIQWSPVWMQRLAVFDRHRTSFWLGLAMILRAVPYVVPHWGVFVSVPNAASGPGFWIDETTYGWLSITLGMAQIGMAWWKPRSRWRSLIAFTASAYWMYAVVTLLGTSKLASPGGWMFLAFALACAYGGLRVLWRL